jgi:hypothetical protein
MKGDAYENSAMISRRYERTEHVIIMFSILSYGSNHEDVQSLIYSGYSLLGGQRL